MYFSQPQRFMKIHRRGVIWYCSNRGWASYSIPPDSMEDLMETHLMTIRSMLISWRFDIPVESMDFPVFFLWEVFAVNRLGTLEMNKWKHSRFIILNFDLHVFLRWRKPTNPAFTTASNECVGGFLLVGSLLKRWWVISWLHELPKNPQDIAVRLSEIRMASTWKRCQAERKISIISICRCC